MLPGATALIATFGAYVSGADLSAATLPCIHSHTSNYGALLHASRPQIHTCTLPAVNSPHAVTASSLCCSRTRAHMPAHSPVLSCGRWLEHIECFTAPACGESACRHAGRWVSVCKVGASRCWLVQGSALARRRVIGCVVWDGCGWVMDRIGDCDTLEFCSVSRCV
jgi:hypothetical protein